MAKVKVMVLLILMPIICAAPISSDTARMALPILVFCTRTVSAAMETTATDSVTRVVRDTFSPPML